MTTGMAAVYLILAFIAFSLVVFGLRWLAAWMTYINNRD
jgi:hypothetical protein